MIGLKPFDPAAILLIAALNPAVIAVAFLMGRKADQWQKLPVAAFAASLAGFVLVWVAAWLRILPAKGIGGEAGLFLAQFVLALAWAGLGYWLAQRRTAR